MSQSKIYVGNLSYDATQDDLHDFFSQYGEITETKLISDRETGRSKGFAFITYADAAHAQEALAANGTELMGRTLKVNEAREGQGGGRRGGGGGRGGNRRFNNHNRDHHHHDSYRD